MDQGNSHSLYDHKEAKGVVLFFLGTDCPLANLYLHRVAKLHKKYKEKGYVFYGVNSNFYDDVEGIAKHRKANDLPYAVLLDRDQKVADALNVDFTPTVVVTDNKWTVR